MTTTPTRGRTLAGIAWGPVAWISILHSGARLAPVPASFRWHAVLVCVLLHRLTDSSGIGLTYDRLLTHRGFAVRRKALEYPVPTVGRCATGRVADPRCHHAHSGDEDDAHRPDWGCGRARMARQIAPELAAVHTAANDSRPAPGRRWEPGMISITIQLLQTFGLAHTVRPPGPKSAPELAIVLVPDIPTPCVASTA